MLEDRHYLFVLLLILCFLNPITIFWMGLSATLSFPVLMIFLVWIYIKWTEYSKIGSKGSLSEILLGLALIIGNLVRNVLNPASMSFGIFDMLVMLVGLYVIFFGFKATKFFTPLIVYNLILIIGYQLEFSLEQVMTLQEFLAQLMNSLLNSLSIVSWVSSNIVILIDRAGETHNLVIDAPCTGMKGMLAYGSLAALLVMDLKSRMWKKGIAITIGLLGTFLVNILRLAIIFLAVYFLGIDIGLLIHTYLGYGIWTIWVVFFWSIAFKYLTPSRLSDLPSSPISSEK